MKKFAHILIALIITGLSTSAYAESGKHKRGYSNHHYSKHHYSKGHHYGKGHWGYRRHRGHRSYSFGHHLGHIAGGIVVGAAVHSIFHHHHRPKVIYQQVPVYRDPEPVVEVIHQEKVVKMPDRWYSLEDDGTCLLINKNKNGDEIRTKVPKQNCE